MAAKRQLKSELHKLHRLREPIYPADFASTKLPADQNAANDLLAAGEIVMKRDETSKAFEWLTPGLPLSEKEVAIIGQMVESRRQIFELLDSAASKPTVQWEIDYAEPGSINKAGISSVRSLSDVLIADALLAHQQGRDSVAFKRIHQMFMLARAIDRQPSIVPHLVASSIDIAASDTAAEIASDLQIGSEAGVDSAAVKALIDELLDDRPSRAGMVNALRGERKDCPLIASEMLEGMDRPSKATKSSDFSSIAAYVIKPHLLDEARLMVRLKTAQIRAFEKSADFPTFASNANVDCLFPEIGRSPTWHWVSWMTSNSSKRPVQAHYQATANLRMAAVALAARWYAIEHNGSLPASLDQLVPIYLSTIPIDPMTTGNAPLHYRALGPDPIVYSVGNDRIDNGGSDKPAEKNRNYDGPLDPWRCEDAVLHLIRQPRHQASINSVAPYWARLRGVKAN